METKRCYKCKETKPILDFVRNKSKKDGLSSYCKRCNSNYMNSHYKNNTEMYAKAQDKHQRTLKGRFTGLKSSAKLRGIQVTISLAEYLDLMESSICGYCELGLPIKGGGLDRLDSNKPYEKANCVACCSACNIEKGSGLSGEEYRLIWAIRKGKIPKPVL